MMHKIQVFNTDEENYFRNWFPQYFESLYQISGSIGKALELMMNWWKRLR